MTGTLSTPSAGSPRSTEEPKIATAVTTLNGLLTSSNTLDGAQLGAATVPNSALAGSITAANLAGSIPDSKLSSPNNSVYRTLTAVGPHAVSGGATGTYYFTEATGGVGGAQTAIIAATGTTTVIASSGSGPSGLIYFDDADYAVGSLTQKLRIRQQVMVGATSPSTVTLNCGLYPITISAGNWTLGTVVSGSATSTSGLATNTISSFTSASGDFTIPADGAYALGIVIGSITCPGAIYVAAQLQTRNV